MRASLRWLLAAFALLLAGVLVDTARAAPREGLLRALQPYLEPTMPGTPIQAAVLLQRADCSGNLRMFDLMQRKTVAPNLRLAVLWYVGPSSDSVAIRQLLPSWTGRTPLRPAPTAALAELRRLGHRDTPTLIVLDQNGRIRFTTRSPRSLREFAGLQHIIEGLTWIEEL
jgi:hypothetical protein